LNKYRKTPIKKKEMPLFDIVKVSVQRLSEEESAENRCFTRERTESLSGSYGWSLDGISNIAGIGLL
jgi:hypothetical protein